MVKSLVDVGLPRLVVPGGLPESFADRFAMLLIRGRMGRRRSIEISGRFLTELSSRSDRRAVARRLKRLVDEKHLVVVKRSTFTSGTVYGRPPLSRRPSADERALQPLANVLFGEAGICREFVEDPAFRHGELNQSGVLVLGVLAHCSEPVKLVAVKRYLDGVLGARNVSAAIKKFRDKGLLVDGDLVALVPDWRERLKRIGAGAPAARAKRVKEKHAAERAADRRRRGLPSLEDESIIKAMRCVVCGCDPDSSFETEHFPAQVFLERVLGLKDRKSARRAHPAFLHPICGLCHSELRKVFPRLLRVPVPSVRVGELKLWTSSSDARGSALSAALLRRAGVYYVAVKRGDFSGAVLAIAEGCEIWRKWTEFDPSLRSVTRVSARSGSRKVRGARHRTSSLPQSGVRARSRRRRRLGK